MNDVPPYKTRKDNDYPAGSPEAKMQDKLDKAPALKISWLADEQVVHVDFDPKTFKTFEFMLAVLNMAVQAIETNRKAQHMAQMQQAMAMQQQKEMQAAQQQAAIEGRILRGR